MNKQYKIWHGQMSKHIDEVVTETFENVITGSFGGASISGGDKNEDGYLLLKPTKDSTFAVLFDSHTTNESVVYFTELLQEHLSEIIEKCSLPINRSMIELQQKLLTLLFDNQTSKACEQLTGETAILFTFQKSDFLWWLSIGDNSLYVFHPEFNELGQHQVNQRIYYQWMGQKNSMALNVPCYTSGTLQLRSGENKILMLTDGVLEIEGRPYEDSKLLEKIYTHQSLKEGTEFILNEVQQRKGRDSATMLAWSVTCKHEPLRPSRL